MARSFVRGLAHAVAHVVEGRGRSRGAPSAPACGILAAAWHRDASPITSSGSPAEARASAPRWRSSSRGRGRTSPSPGAGSIALAEVVAQIEALGRRGLAVACDVTDDADVARAADEVVSRLGKLDVVVANAGFGVTGKIESLPIDAWHRQFATNVFGVASTIRHTLPHLRASRGRLALIASVAGMIPTPGNGAYAASKYAVRGLGQTLAIELAGSGVSCTLIHPGFVASEIAQVDNGGRFDPKRRDPRPAKLMWTAEDAARVIARAIHRRAREYTFTAHGKLGGFLGRHLPGFVHLVMSRIGRRSGRR
ncbi:MAG: SDR family NAD(P)-dependent oxidoreductase [Nannocystaceae bacterium]